MNIVFFVVLLLLIGGGAKGYKRGMVEEVNTVLALVLALAAIAMFVVAAQGYMEHETLRTILGIVCMTVAILVYKIADFILSSLKLISSVPVLRGVNKLLGFGVGVLESVLLIWAIFIVIVAFEFGGISNYILTQMRENALLTWLFKNNYLADMMAGWLPVISEVLSR
ncbi:MAG: CvpA family protein [Lachnospiraceae bacterium]|nr:CvpA family protein [Lachnospiraceae bacterium]